MNSIPDAAIKEAVREMATQMKHNKRETDKRLGGNLGLLSAVRKKIKGTREVSKAPITIS